MDFIWRMFDTDGFPPRWQCGTGWEEDPSLGWVHIASDLVTWVAYLLIPCVLAYYVFKKKDVSFPRLFWLFCAFILACGTVHLLEAVTFWTPVYRLSAIFKLTTAVTSAATVIALARIAPTALALPGLAEVNARLTEEIAVRRSAEQRLLDANMELRAALDKAEAVEAKLRDSEAKLRGIFDNTRSFIGMLTPDGVLLDANRTSLKAAGVRDDLVMNKPFWEGPWWSHSSFLQERLKQAINSAASGQVVQFEASHPTDSGTQIDIDFSLSPICSENGQVLYLVPEGRNITEQKRRERDLETALAQLENAERELRINQFATDNATDAVFFVREDGTFSYVNQQACESLGYSKDELLSLSIADITPEYKRSHWHAAWRDVRSKKAVSFEGRHQRKDGSLYDCAVTTNFLEFDTTQFVHAIVRDVTLDKELKLKVKESENQMRLTFESSPIGLLVANRDGKISMVNPQMTNMFGYKAEEMLGETIELLIPQRHHKAHVDHRNRYQTNRQSRQMGTGVELFGLRKDGTEVPLEIGLTPIDEEAGTTMATINDISQRKRNERHILQKNEQLSRVNTELLEFAYSTSHDLKGPLVSIAALLEFCESDLHTGEVEEVHANLEKSKELAKRLASRVESILTLAKSDMESGETEVIPVKQRIEDAWDALPHSGVSLQTSVEHTEPIHSVSVRFDAILENLLSNAIKYQDPNQHQKFVRISTWTSGHDFFLSVEDNGVGIPPESQEKVFRLFYRLANTDQSGTGLGLPLVKKNVTRLGGQIDLQSSNGITNFIVRLPQLYDDAPDSL